MSGEHLLEIWAVVHVESLKSAGLQEDVVEVSVFSEADLLETGARCYRRKNKLGEVIAALYRYLRELRWRQLEDLS